MSLISRILKANPSAQVSSVLTGSFTIPSAKGAFDPFIYYSSARGLFAGGSTGVISDVIDYIQIETTGNATDFGDLTVSRFDLAGVSSTTRAVFGGGENANQSVLYNVLDYVTIASTGNATNFGTLTSNYGYQPGSCSNSITGLFGGGYPGSGSTPLIGIDYITIASTGNATDFGDLSQARRGNAGLASNTRGVIAGGYTGSYVNTIDYVTIATTGNATDFGDLTVGRYNPAGCSSPTRGLVMGGNAGAADLNVIDYITIATTGNAIDFGDLTVARNGACASSSIRGVLAGGYSSNVIDYVTIASLGNATDFGDSTLIRHIPAGASSGHGGLS